MQIYINAFYTIKYQHVLTCKRSRHNTIWYVGSDRYYVFEPHDDLQGERVEPEKKWIEFLIRSVHFFLLPYFHLGAMVAL